MPPNRRAISCPDLFALDDDWVAYANQHVANKAAANDHHGDSGAAEHTCYWDMFHSADGDIIVDPAAIEFLGTGAPETRAFVNTDGVGADTVSTSDKSESFSGGADYWTWTQWRGKDAVTSQNNESSSVSTNNYWDCCDELLEQHAIKNLYKTNSRRFREVIKQKPVHEDLYWHGM